MFGTRPELDIHQKTLEIKQDDKFFSKLVSKENSTANPSFRVYYGGVSVAVPFVWESQPGTPKHKLSENTLPPLTPPPSYYTNSDKKPAKRHSRSKLLHLLFPRLINNLKKTHNDTAFSSSSSALSSTTSSASSNWSSSLNSSTLSPLTPRNYHERRSRFWSRGSSFDSRAWALDDEAEGNLESPTSTLCFGINGGLKGCYSCRS